MSSFWLGFGSGVPLMIAVGPIAVLLVELGIQSGWRDALPGALGVATADLTFALIAAMSGATLQHVLQPHAVTMQWIAATVLVVLAAVMLRSAGRDIWAARQRGLAAHASGDVPVNFGGIHNSIPDSGCESSSSTEDCVELPSSRTNNVALWAKMYALTIMNPMTIVAFTSLVVATGSRASTVGWPIGIAVASVVVHVGLVVLGSAVRKTLPPIGPAYLRLAGSILITGLAVNLVFAA